MRIAVICSAIAVLGASSLALASPALAQDDMADLARDAIGVPMPLGEAAGAWTLQSGGHAVCRLTMSAQKLGQAFYGADVPQDCDGVLPPGIAGWKPVTDGLAFVDDQGRILIDFNRWTSTSLTTRGPGGVLLSLKRAS